MNENQAANNAARRFDISSDWVCTRAVKPDGIEFLLHSTINRVGYSLKISNWRLRKVPPTSGLPSPSMGDLILSMADELRKATGCNLLEEIHADMGQQHTGLMSANDKHFNVAFLQALFLPRIALLSVPFYNLICLNKVPYVLENVPWPRRLPPRTLFHLARTGFESRFKLGILASPVTDNNVWVISEFSECEVEPIWSLKSMVHEDFPDFRQESDLPSGAWKKLRDQVAEIHQYVNKINVSPNRKKAARRNGSKGGRERDPIWNHRTEVKILWKENSMFKRDARCAIIREKLGMPEVSERTISRVATGR